MFRKSHAGAKKNGFFLGQPIGTHEVAIGTDARPFCGDKRRLSNTNQSAVGLVIDRDYLEIEFALEDENNG